MSYLSPMLDICKKFTSEGESSASKVRLDNRLYSNRPDDHDPTMSS